MLPKGPYQPQLTESEILKFWLDNKFYAPEYRSERKLSTAYLPQHLTSEIPGKSRTTSEDDRETFTIILPPPNANGNLHLGHMSGYAYQDLMGRFARMQGKKVLLLPGKDHAGIQTEVVFERELEKEGISKRELGREEFYRRCYEFCMEKSENARSQEQKIGLSADFDRELFTLDPKIVAEVMKAFELMYKDGLVYRDKRIINWCPRCQSALADIDTEFKDSVSPFYFFKYGFLEPEQDAVKIKNDFKKLEEVEWVFERATTIDGKEKYPFALGTIKGGYNIEVGEMYVHCLGFDNEKLKKGDILKGKPYAILMRLNNKFSLILTNPDFKGDLDKELLKLWEIAESKKRDAGIYFIKFDEYPEDKFYTNGFVLGTVRPETKFGDTALAVDPDDERYKEYVGKEFEVRTLTGTAKIKVIADKAVDENFGTGMVKVTPAHSMEDWEIAQRHKEDAMPEKQVINFDGKLNHLTGKYEGMTVKEARKAMIPDMKEAGMLVYLDENYQNRIRICERCKHPIEPLISYQWFVDTKPLKAEAKRLVEQGFTEIMPEGKKKTYMQWMDTEEDWCITRQLWWGYRLPVWYKGKREQYITETGEVKEKIADKVIEKVEDYEGLLSVGIDAPDGLSSNDTIQLTVVRHAQSEHNKSGVYAGKFDADLSEEGRLAAETLAKDFTGDFDVIITSPLKRTRQTAEILNKDLKLKLETNDLLVERDYGNLEGLSWEEFEQKFPEEAAQNFEHFQPKLEKGETIAQVEERIDKFLNWLKESGYKNPLIVTHAGIIRIFERKLSELTPEQSRELGLENLTIRNYKLTDHGIDHTETNSTNKSEWQQDEDVLDTWFSSGQWPFVTLMAKAGDYENFYPTQVMETGWDILLFWVTRMMLLNPYRARLYQESDEKIVPFKHVYLHGLVLDKNGIKMSKSKGNGIDPFEMMQKYGTDALRFSFVKGNSVGQNYRLYEEKIAANRNFCNKIWNASKFVMFNIEDNADKLLNLDRAELKFTDDDKDFLEQIDKLTAETTRRLTEFQFGVAAEELYESFWHQFADIYLEQIKTRLYTKDRDGNPINTAPEEQESRLAAQWVLLYSLGVYLKLLHPFMPFITENIWQSLPKKEEEAETIMYSRWPR